MPEDVFLPEVDREGDGYSLELKSLSGIAVSNQSATGEILNTGHISVRAGLEDAFPFFDYDDGVGISVNGISVRQGSEVKGITNTGTISADTFGILVQGEGSEGSTRVDGSILNAKGAVITSGFNGIFVDRAEVTGSVINSGEITSLRDDHLPFANGIHIKDSLVHQDVRNDGVINSGVEGIEIEGGEIRGSVVNTGELNIDSDGFYIGDAALIKGDLVSTGTIRAKLNDGVDVTDSTIEGSVLLSGVIEAGDNAIEIDGGFLNGGRMVDGEPAPFVYTVIGGDFNNSASLTSVTIENDDEFDEIDGGDGFDMDFVKIGGSLINSGAIDVTKKGFDLEDINITADFINSGSIVAGEEGVKIKYEGVDGRADDEDLEYPEIGPTEIGGHFVNAGNIEAVDTGILLEQISIGKNFENRAAVESGKASAIDIRAASIAGDFINTGDLTADTDLFRKEGEYYREEWDGVPSEDGKLRLTSMGVDSNGDAWFRIRNESADASFVYLDEYGGDFKSEDIFVPPGQVIYINTGEHDGGSETHRLFDASGDGQLQVKASGQHDFMSQPIEATQRGISLTGNIYADDGALVVERSLEVGGSVINSGDIDANDEGVYIRDAVIGGGVENSGVINAGDDGIVLRNSSIKSVVNSGSINAGTVEEDGSAYGNGIAIYDASVDDEEILSVRNTVDGSITAADVAIQLDTIDGNTLVVNEGVINAREDAIDFERINGSIDLKNSGSVTARQDAVEVNGGTGELNLLNEGQLRAENDDGSADVLDFGNRMGDITVVNKGSMVASGVNGGVDVFDIGSTDGNIVISNSGTIEAIGNEGSGGNDAFDIHSVKKTLTILNTGSIAANSVGDGNDALDLGSIEGDLKITNAGTISADGAGSGNNAIDIGTVRSDVTIDNEGSISASGHAIEIESARDGAVVIQNTGSITSGDDVMQVFGVGDGLTILNGGSMAGDSDVVTAYNISGDIKIENTGEMAVAGSTVDVIDIRDAFGNVVITNTGDMTSNGDDSGAGVVSVRFVRDDVDVINTGLIEGTTLENTDNNDAVDIGDVKGNVSVGNSGDINANFVGGDDNNGVGLRDISGNVEVINTGDISALGSVTNSGLDIKSVEENITIVNSGSIRSGGIAVEIDNRYNDGVLSLNNSGTIESVSAAAIYLEGEADGKITNYGTIDGGIYQQPEELVLSGESDRSLDYSSAVAVDYRFAESALDFLNGQNGSDTGSVDGDIYGSDLDSDQVEFAAGQYGSNIYDVENINVTGLVGFSGDLFSLNNDSQLTVADTGTLSLSSDDQVNLEGRYSQQGGMVLVINQNTAALVDPLLDVTGDAQLDDGTVLRVSVENQDIAHLNSAAGSQEVHLIHADQGVVDRGLNVQSDSILFNYEKFERTSGEEGNEEFGLIASINSLGDLGANGGADNNAVNALNGLQGADSSGLEALRGSNPELYNNIYNGTEESLAALGDALLASPDSGIVASQGAQSEALSTILARIAELRSGVSGISAGDQEAPSKFRPDALWLRAIHSEGRQDAVNSSNGSFNPYVLRSTGFTIGLDKDFTDNLTLGAGFSHATSRVNEQASAAAANTETSSYISSLYGSWRNQAYFVDATFNYGVSKNKLKKSGVEADFDSSQFGFSVLVGRGFLFNDNDSLLEPQIGFNYTRLDSDGYSYNSGVNVSVGSQTLEAVELGAGLRFTNSFEVGNGVLLPEASLMMWHDFAADSVSAELEFETGGGSFVYFGPEGVKNRYQAGLGLEYLMDNNVTLTARYDRNWRSGFGADTWTAKVRYDF